mmetsp:Transcript_8039/g.19927  ORF Transcript_8039/g.19927 Transcript_8039/m.19927 type:complete len:305 (-) Transcript_8039:450-1364(-)
MRTCCAWHAFTADTGEFESEARTKARKKYLQVLPFVFWEPAMLSTLDSDAAGAAFRMRVLTSSDILAASAGIAAVPDASHAATTAHRVSARRAKSSGPGALSSSHWRSIRFPLRDCSFRWRIAAATRRGFRRARRALPVPHSPPIAAGTCTVSMPMVKGHVSSKTRSRSSGQRSVPAMIRTGHLAATGRKLSAALARSSPDVWRRGITVVNGSSPCWTSAVAMPRLDDATLTDFFFSECTPCVSFLVVKSCSMCGSDLARRHARITIACAGKPCAPFARSDERSTSSMCALRTASPALICDLRI